MEQDEVILRADYGGVYKVSIVLFAGAMSALCILGWLGIALSGQSIESKLFSSTLLIPFFAFALFLVCGSQRAYAHEIIFNDNYIHDCDVSKKPIKWECVNEVSVFSERGFDEHTHDGIDIRFHDHCLEDIDFLPLVKWTHKKRGSIEISCAGHDAAAFASAIGQFAPEKLVNR